MDKLKNILFFLLKKKIVRTTCQKNSLFSPNFLITPNFPITPIIPIIQIIPNSPIILKTKKPRRINLRGFLMKEGGFLLSRIALQYHRRKWA